MTLNETRKAIRGIASNYGEDRIWASTQVCTFADLKELEAAYTKLEDAALDVIKQAQFSIPSNARRVSGTWFVVEKLKEVLESREDPERVELASAPSGGELSGR